MTWYYRKKIMERRGAGVLISFFIMVSLIFVIVFLASLIAAKSKLSNLSHSSRQALSIAESAADIGMRSIRDDVGARPQTKNPYNYGYVSGVGIDPTKCSMPDMVRAVSSYSANNDEHVVLSTPGSSIEVYDFPRLGSYLGTRIYDVKVGVRVVRTKPTDRSLLTVSISKDGGRVWHDAPNDIEMGDGWSKKGEDIHFLSLSQKYLSWKTLYNPDQVRIKITKKGGQASVLVDHLFLLITVEIDTITEPWSTASYISLPAVCLGGSIDTIHIEAESGKVHLNTAPLALITSLFMQYGVSQEIAVQCAQNIIAYRDKKPITHIEELLLIDGISPSVYNVEVVDPDRGSRKLFDDITVYSWINSFAGNRAPININTASHEVLAAVCTPIIGSDKAVLLARDIIAKRGDLPFACISATYPENKNMSYADFITKRTYLLISDKEALVLSADFSRGHNTLKGNTAQFSFYSNSFLINGKGMYPKHADGVTRGVRVLYGDIYDYESMIFSQVGSLRNSVIPGEVGFSGYWVEE